MPIVWDEALGKYVAAKAKAPAEPVASPADEDIPLGDDDLPPSPPPQITGSAGGAAEGAALTRALRATEQMRKRAELAEARIKEGETKHADLEEQLAAASALQSELEEKLATTSQELEAKLEELAALERATTEGRAALEAAQSQLAAERGPKAAEREEAFRKAQEKREEEVRGASAAAEEKAAKHLAATLEQERERAEAHLAEVQANMKAEFAREQAAAKRALTKEMFDLVGAVKHAKKFEKDATDAHSKKKKGGSSTSPLPARNGGAAEKDESAAAAKKEKADRLIAKAQARAESWQIANLGRTQIELVHMIHERLEKLVAVADDLAARILERAQTGLVDGGSGGSEADASGARMRALAHAALEELDGAKEQLYAQLYSQDNMLGYHYLRNYPMTPREGVNTRWQPKEAAPAAAPMTPTTAGTTRVAAADPVDISGGGPSIAEALAAAAPVGTLGGHTPACA